MPASRSLRGWIPLAVLGLVASSVSAACYYPDGSDANRDYNYQPCGDSNTTYSTCCYFGEGDRCLQNGLCNNPGKHDYRAACQNKDWANCPQVCMDSELASRPFFFLTNRTLLTCSFLPLAAETGTWLPLEECGTNEYCCPPSQGEGCCSNGAQILTLDAPEPSAKSDAPTTTASDGGDDPLRTTIIMTVGPASTGDSGRSEKNSVPVGAIAGGTVGGVTFVGVLVLAPVCFIRRRKRRSKASLESETGTGDSDDKKDPQVQSVDQPAVAEAEGSQGKKFLEADSKLLLEADSNPLSEADSRPIDAAPLEDADKEKKAAARSKESGTLYELP